MKRIYIAGKLNDDAVGYIKNMHRMIKTANQVKSSGFSVLVPCLDILCGLIDGNFDYSDYFENNIEWLKAADGVFLVPGWQTSEGTKKEINIAKMRGIPVFEDHKEMLDHFEV